MYAPQHSRPAPARHWHRCQQPSRRGGATPGARSHYSFSLTMLPVSSMQPLVPRAIALLSALLPCGPESVTCICPLTFPSNIHPRDGISGDFGTVSERCAPRLPLHPCRGIAPRTSRAKDGGNLGRPVYFDPDNHDRCGSPSLQRCNHHSDDHYDDRTLREHQCFKPDPHRRMTSSS
jgi:hypothetical protein